MFIIEINTIYLTTLIAFKVKFGSPESRRGPSETVVPGAAEPPPVPVPLNKEA
jgi:hypothetical protein